MKATVDPYLRLLAAISLVVVVSGAVLDLAWLPLLFPAVGVLFAVGGAFAASAVDDAASGRIYLRRALASLLLPFWLFAAAMVSFMLTLGWEADPYQGAEPLEWGTAWLWLLPLSEPPASVDGLPWVLTAWFVPAYLCLVVATPALLWLFRRWPLRLMALPVLTLLVLTAGIATLTGRARDVVVAVCVYACCWLVGFARHDRTLFRLPLRGALAAGVVFLGAGLAYAARQGPLAATTIDDIPLAAQLYSLGAVVLLLRAPWQGKRLASGWTGGVLSAVGARTTTIFLWTPAVAAAAVPALALSPLADFHTDDASGVALQYATTWVLLLLVVLAIGWVEDVGAGRWPTLLGRRRREVLPRAPRPAPYIVRDNVVQQLPVPADPGRPVRPVPEPAVPQQVAL